MDFVDKSAQATELYNGGKYHQALPLFESIAQSYADLDTDGFGLLGMGDCLAAMGRFDEARTAYQAAPAPDARHRAAIDQRLAELKVKAPLTDDALRDLAAAAEQPGDSQFAAMWRYARALEKRALDSLTAAAQTFRNTASAAGERAIPVEKLLNQATYLEELVDDLKFLVDEAEGTLQMPKNIGPDEKSSDKPTALERHVRLLVSLPDGRRAQIELDAQAAPDPGTVKVDGREVTLTPAVRRLLQRHLDRVTSLILDSQKQPPSGTTRK
jgi:tetratricopeptide (TPR) repeat protein